MDLSKVKGYKKLLKWQQELLDRVHAKHMASVEDKSKWEIKSVTWQRTFLNVLFQNGEWLHYTTDGYWY